jgi:hypothetical protein
MIKPYHWHYANKGFDLMMNFFAMLFFVLISPLAILGWLVIKYQNNKYYKI